MRRNDPIVNLMTKDTVTVQVGQPPSVARQLLTQHRFHHLPVLEGKRLVGILSTNDFLKFSLRGWGSDDRTMDALLDQQITIVDMMTQSPITLSEKCTVRDAVQVLNTGKFHSIPIVDAQENLVGLVTRKLYYNIVMANLIPFGVNTTTGRLQTLSTTDSLVDTSSRNIIGSNLGTIFISIDDMYQYSSVTFPSITLDGVQARIRAFDITTDPAFAFTFLVPQDYSNTVSTFGLPGGMGVTLIASPSTAASGPGVFQLSGYSVYQVATNTINSSGGSGAMSVTATTGPTSINLSPMYSSQITGGISPGDLITVRYQFSSGSSTFLGILNVRGLMIRYPIRA